MSIVTSSRERNTDQREVRFTSLALSFLILLAGALTLSTPARLGEWTQGGLRWQHWLMVPVWTLGALLLHRALARRLPDRDPYLLPLLLLLSGWGTLEIWRLNTNFGLRQTGWFLLSVLVVLLLLQADRRLLWLRRYRYLWMVAGLALMVLTLLAGTNPSGGDQRLWLGCCGIYLQPSEPLRLLLVAFLASYLADRLSLRGKLRQIGTLRALLPLLFVGALSLLLLLAQRDLGTGLLFLGLITALLYTATGQRRFLFAGTLLALGGGLLGSLLFSVVRLRIDAWLNPWLDPSGRSYQIVQSLIAVASGGVFGKGPGLGSPGFVPAIHTDFIFTALVEEFGLLGGIAIIACFAFLLTRGLRISLRNQDPFAALLAAGITLSLGLQAILILAGNLRALPLVGITLPFMSYGGSSLLTSFIGIGFLMLLSGREETSFLGSRPIFELHLGGLLAWAGLAMVLGWWTIYRAPALTARSDNPRRSIDGLYARRGTILDRNGIILAQSTGSPGSYERVYPLLDDVPAVGYDSFAFGQTGIEESMDATLRGLNRSDTLFVDWTLLAQGHPPPGQDIRLTLDSRLQSDAMQQLGDQVGSVVLLQAESGDILTLASSPGFDPNRLDERSADLIANPNSPLLNRATLGSYQPGTLLLPFELAAGAERGWLDPQAEAGPGSPSIPIDSGRLDCSYPPPSSGRMTLEQAVLYACPGPFSALETSFGWQGLSATEEMFGFGLAPQVRIPTTAGVGRADEPEGSLPDALAGQGEMTLSPLQAAHAFTGLIAAGGMPGLRIVDAVRQEDGTWQRLASIGETAKPLGAEIQDRVRSWMWPNTGGIVGYRASAIRGAGGQTVAWYLGWIESERGAAVVAVALETGTAIQAQEIGITLLESYRETVIP
ncbi:MAG: FtsW/RodA/SpoVE family cell cycle protein [Anaerolineales bacterium]